MQPRGAQSTTEKLASRHGTIGRTETLGRHNPALTRPTGLCRGHRPGVLYSSMQSSPRRALMWSLAERYVNFLIGLGSTLALARLLTPGQVGVYSVCAAFATMAALLRDFGVSEYLIQEHELTRDKVRSAMGIALCTAWSLGTLVWLTREPIARYFAEPGVAQVLAVTALQFFILPLSSPAFALLNREMAFRQIFFLQTATNVAHAATALTLALAGWGTMSLAWAPVVAVVVQTLILAWQRPQDTFVVPTLREARSVLRFGVAYMTSRTVENLAQNAHEPIIAKVFGFAELGWFSRAVGMVDMFRSNVADAITRVATPAFASEHRAGRPVAQALLRATTVFSALSWPFFGFVALASHEIVLVLFGPQWMAAAPLATVLALSALPAGLYEFVPQMLSATGHVRRRLQLAMWVSSTHIAAVLAAAWFGLAAMAAAFVLSGLVMLVLCAWHLRQALGLPLTALARAGAGSLLVAVASVAAQAATLTLCRAADLHALLALMTTLAVGALAWLAAARWQQHPALQEILRAWHTLRRRAPAAL